MKNLLIKIYSLSVMLGFDPKKTTYAIKGIGHYFLDLKKLKKQEKKAKVKFPFGKLYPCFEDRTSESGSATGHYFHQDLLVARRIFQNNPDIHMDIGSRIDGFVSHVASFRPIEVFDIRPMNHDIPNIKFKLADFMKPVSEETYACCDSLSCLHAIEHFGLGRYGDPIQYDGYLLGLENLKRVLKKNGKLYFSVPIGPQRIEFNGHRVFSVKFLLELFSKDYKIDSFSYVDDKGDLHENKPLIQNHIQNNFGCDFGCGIFEMTKISNP